VQVAVVVALKQRTKQTVVQVVQAVGALVVLEQRLVLEQLILVQVVAVVVV
jgi:hypothetical protein